MNKKSIERWVDTAEIGSSVVYYTGSLAEDRCHKKNVADIPDAFADEAEKGRVDLFQNKVKEGSANHKPIYEYIAKKLKNKRNKSIGQGR